MRSVKQDGIKYHFLNLWYDSTWDWTLVSQAIGEYSNHYANGDKYLDLARELKKPVELKEMVILIVIGALGMVHKCLKKRLRELDISRRIKPIQRWMDRWNQLDYLDESRKPAVNQTLKNSKNLCEKLMRSKIVIIIICMLGMVSEGWNSWKLVYKSRPFKLLHCQDWPEYWEESWKNGEICVTQTPVKGH